MIRRMKRVYVLYTRAQQEELIRALQRLGVLHLEEAPATGEAEPHVEGELAERRREVENLLIKARGVLDLFREVDPELVQGAASAPVSSTSLPELEGLFQAFRGEIEGLEGRLRALVSERRTLRDRLAAVERFREIVHAAEELLRDLPLEGREVFALLGETQDRQLLPQIEETLEQTLAGRYHLVRRELSEGRVLVIVSVEPDYSDAVRGYLEAKGLRPLAFPPHIEGEFQQGIAQLRAEETTLPRRLEALEAELRTLAAEHIGKLLPLTAALENRLAQLDAALRFGYTDFSMLVTGWVPADELPRFREELSRRFPGIVINEDPQPSTPEEVPVAFQNPPWVRPYQLFLELMGLPKYGSVDPTPFVSLFFPTFFGLIVGDFGYGLALLGIVLWAKRKWGHKSEMLRHGLTIATHASAMAVLFGLVFGEFFGFVMPWPHFPRLKAATSFLLFAVALGAVQILLGFALGAINALRERSPKHLAAKVGGIVVLLAIGIVVGTLSGVLPEELRTPGIALLVAALAMLLYGEGFIGILEVFTYVGHVVSYARIMGFGLAAVVLAELANEAAGAVGNLVLGVLVGLALHAAHLVLDAFESTIQSARLHLVEFFQKFYEAGGRTYEPFREHAGVPIREE